MSMNTIYGKVVVKETGNGIEDLLIVVYDLDPQTKLQELLEICYDGKNFDIWQHISGDRLGSRLTDKNGNFDFQYDDSQFQVKDREWRPDLTLFVVAPEDQSIGSCPKILHVSCGIRHNAGRIEHYIIKLPLQKLREAGILYSGALDVSVDFNDIAAKMRTQAEERHKKLIAEKPFSQRYKERQEQIAKQFPNDQKQERPPQSFNLAIPMLFTENEVIPPEATISYDKESGALTLKKSKDAEPIPLTFKGVMSEDELKKNQRELRGFGYIIDIEKKEVYVKLPLRSSNKLVRQESEPSALFSWYIEKRRKSENATLADASVDK